MGLLLILLGTCIIWFIDVAVLFFMQILKKKNWCKISVFYANIFLFLIDYNKGMSEQCSLEGGSLR